MLVLIITLVLTTNTVSAKSYVADDSVSITSQYHDIFNNYFNESIKYTYFPYECEGSSYNRTCYFGIDENGKYLNISYLPSGNNYILNYSNGIDEEFSVSGSNVFIHEPSSSTLTNYAIIFIFLIILILKMI